MRVFFFCVKPGSPDNTGYCHGSVALAEGLKALGVEVYGNVPYWQRTPDPASVLIPFERAVLPDDCDVVVVDSNHGINGESIPDVAKCQTRSFRSVYIDFQDGAITKTWDPELRGFDLILKMHANRRTRLPTNAQPWAFGLTERIIEAGAGSVTRARGRMRVTGSWGRSGHSNT